MYKENNTIMKRLFIGMTVVAVVMTGLSSCGEAARTTYSDSEYVMFADTMSLFPVQNSNDYFTVPVASTVACDYDRTYGVEVIDRASNAIEGRHYEFESNSVTIKAGEKVADLKIRGIYENIEKTDSLSVTLRLLTDEGTKWDLYGVQTRVQIMKSCPFNLDVFTGYCKVTSTYFRSYMTNTDLRLIETTKVEGENAVILHDFYYDGYDIKLKFDASDPLEPFVDMDKDQMIGNTPEAFDKMHGNGKMLVEQPAVYTSYYNVCQSFVVQYITLYVKGIGTVGTYVNILEWISDEEAALLKKEGY